ncbi:hypothetical protein EI427_23525 [Flammeovirga pectinis]|uniref:Uncharacterized protein n=1 Tax=Flammeovirga pectinis TaxID=2494373 RepID=A0A3Q9FS77_9BACT|nr:hypothetical protein [Flammeovirga pectinis]AZQ65187.1 hypothetical protein EI427_23525 [Flammeovirga pectinis]
MKKFTLLFSFFLLSFAFGVSAQDISGAAEWMHDNCNQYVAFASNEWTDLTEDQKEELYKIRMQQQVALKALKDEKSAGEITQIEFNNKKKEQGKFYNKKISSLTGRDWKEINNLTNKFWKSLEG